jgi:KDO2-lipid IV(A) lauroyltransferase
MKQPTWRHAVEAAGFRALLAGGRLLPLPALRALGAAAGRVAGVVDRRHTRVAVHNLCFAFGNGMDEKRARALALRSWAHFGRITFETLAFPRFGPSSIGSLVRYEGLDHIRKAYASGRGVLLFSAHYGHWELIALMQGHLGMPLALVARPLDNPRLERMLARLRGSSGNRIIHKRSAVREMLRALTRGEGVAFVPDQDARADGIFVPFFGHAASTTPTLALLALRTGAAVVPTFSVPAPDGTWRVTYEPEVPIEPTADREEDVRRITAACTAIIERWVRRHPELWLWMHRRWKTRPRPDPLP